MQPRAPRYDVDQFFCNGWELLQVQDLWKQIRMVDALRELFTTRRAINGILTLEWLRAGVAFLRVMHSLKNDL